MQKQGYLLRDKNIEKHAFCFMKLLCRTKFSKKTVSKKLPKNLLKFGWFGKSTERKNKENSMHICKQNVLHFDFYSACDTKMNIYFEKTCFRIFKLFRISQTKFVTNNYLQLKVFGKDERCPFQEYH
jgi:hypothetical protein